MIWEGIPHNSTWHPLGLANFTGPERPEAADFDMRGPKRERKRVIGEPVDEASFRSSISCRGGAKCQFTDEAFI